MKSSCCNVLLYGLLQAGRQWSLRLSRVLLQQIGMEQSKADPCVFRKVVDGEVTPIVCVHVDDLLIAVTAKGKETFDGFYAQLKEEFPVNEMGDLSWYLGCAFERDKMEGVMKMTQTALVHSLVDGFDIQYEIQTPASEEFDLEPKRIHEKGGLLALQAGSWWYVVDLGDDATGYSERGEGSGPTCPQSGCVGRRFGR